MITPWDNLTKQLPLDTGSLVWNTPLDGWLVDTEIAQLISSIIADAVFDLNLLLVGSWIQIIRMAGTVL